MFQSVSWIWKTVAGCAVLSGLATGLIQDAGRWTFDQATEIVWPEPGPKDACYENHLDENKRPDAAIYHIIVTVPLDDADKSQFRLIDRSLRRQYGEDLDQIIQVEAIDCPPVQSSDGVAGVVIDEARKNARKLARDSGADVVIWGEVLKADKKLHLRFSTPSETKGKDFDVNDIVLSTDFGVEIGGLIAAKALTRVKVTREQEGGFLVSRMRRALLITGPISSQMPKGLEANDRGAILRAHARANYWLGLQLGKRFYLEESVTTFRAALEEYTRDRVPLDWATIQNNLGNALQTLGQRDSGTERLEQAVTAFRAALEERTRDRVPLDWATTQNNLGNALLSLGKRDSGTERLEQAVTAYRAALEEFTRDRVPLNWATTQNNLGNALQTLGDRENGTERLEQAVTAYRAALEERTRDRVPLDWARTQNNLGNALQALGQRDSGTDRLAQAVTAFRAALEEYTRDRVPLDWAMTQNNLGNALQTLGDRENGTERLEQAVTAYRAALEEWTRDRVPLDWATIHYNMALAFETMAEKAGPQDKERLRSEALAHVELALEGFDPTQTPYSHGKAIAVQDWLMDALR